MVLIKEHLIGITCLCSSFGPLKPGYGHASLKEGFCSAVPYFPRGCVSRVTHPISLNLTLHCLCPRPPHLFHGMDPSSSYFGAGSPSLCCEASSVSCPGTYLILAIFFLVSFSVFLVSFSVFIVKARVCWGSIDTTAFLKFPFSYT